MLAASHADRLARFGTTWLERLLPRDEVEIEVLNEKGAAGAGVTPVLVDGSGSLLATLVRPAPTRRDRSAGRSCGDSDSCRPR